MIKNILYEFLLFCGAILIFPKFLWDYFFRKKYRRSLRQRLGVEFPVIDKGGNQLLWVHAVSVGEVKAIASWVRNFKNSNSGWKIVVSTITETGNDEALRSIPEADYCVYLPLDMSIIIAPIVKKCLPDMVVLVETDFWYNFLRCSHSNGAKVCLVNGKLSEKSKSRYRSLWWLFSDLFSLFDIFCLQGEVYRQRFIEMGVEEGKLLVTGNLKISDGYNSMTVEEKKALRCKFGIKERQKVVVIGSTHRNEEELILDQLQGVKDLFIIVVPRHPERFEEVAEILTRRKVAFKRYSELDENNDKNVVLVDAMGVLQKCYQLATIAIVAGSFVDGVGGHNILEPMYYGVPVICGSYMYSQPDFLRLMKDYHSGEQVSIEDLGIVTQKMLVDMDYYNSLSDNGRALWREQKGAVERVLEAVNNQL